jgi:hypothetical protein
LHLEICVWTVCCSSEQDFVSQCFIRLFLPDLSGTAEICRLTVGLLKEASVMKWKITYDVPNGLVKVMVEGTIIAQRTAEMAIDGIRFAREKKCNKFLIDYTRTDVGDSTLDIYQFMDGLAKLGITHKDSIAIVHPEKDATDHHFAETVAANRGWENISYFTDLGKAVGWLRARNS